MNYIDDLQNKIETFINNELDEYALAIDGYWGSGKTYAIKQVIKKYNTNVKDKNKKMKYVSFNGINDLNFSNLNINSFSISNILNIATLAIDNISNYNIFNPIYQLMGDKKEKVNKNIKILIFDDIERCQCDIDTILGFIDQIKNLGIKIIIILNSLEIGIYNNENNQELYKKIIGHIKGNYNANKKDIKKNS